MKKITTAKLERAFRSAHWQAMQDPRFEYRVTVTDENDVLVEEYPGNDSFYKTNRIHLKTFYFPEGIRRPVERQKAYIRFDLWNDVRYARMDVENVKKEEI